MSNYKIKLGGQLRQVRAESGICYASIGIKQGNTFTDLELPIPKELAEKLISRTGFDPEGVEVEINLMPCEV